MSELILYQTEDGLTRLHLRAADGSVWLTQLEIAALFQTSKQNVSLHARNVLKEGELSEKAVVKESLTTAADGKSYRMRLYRLEMILAVGYRVKGARGTQFRQWATAHLSEYLVKGFVMDDERLKNPGGWDYFDELLARIRDIRASEKRFYQKVRDLFALSSDYRPGDSAAQLFFAEVQNKLLYAVTQQTAAEIIVARADAAQPNMALTAWELRAKQRKALTLDYWRRNVDGLLTFNERPILAGSGSMSANTAKAVVQERYEAFDERRRSDAARAADAEDLNALQAIEKQVKAPGGGTQ